MVRFWPDTEDNGYKAVAVNIDHPTKAAWLEIKSFFKTNKPGIVAHISSMGG